MPIANQTLEQASHQTPFQTHNSNAPTLSQTASTPWNPAIRTLLEKQSNPIWKDRKVLITGGTRGLGLALTEALRFLGARVAVIGRKQESLTVLRKRFTDIPIIQGDVADKNQALPLALSAIDKLAGLDLLIHNAGTLGTSRLKPLADTDCEELEAALQTHVVGPFRLTKALLGPLMENRGTVVFITSDAAQNPYPLWGAYGASKAAMQHMAHIWQEEIKEFGIGVHCFDPGDMLTDLHLQALPDADRTALKHPQAAALELIHWLQRSETFLSPAPTPFSGSSTSSQADLS